MRMVHWTDEQMHALRAYAESHPVKVKDVQAGKVPPVGTIPEHVLDMDGGMRVVFSIEDHPSGRSRHLSVSVSTLGHWPAPAAVLAIGRELGFRPDLEDGRVWREDQWEAINWLQPMNETPDA